MASLLPNGKQSFTDDNGNPLVAGEVYFYIPNTSTKKNTFQDPGQTILNTNPIILDARGEAVIWGAGSFRQVVKDQFGNLIWDQLVQSADADLRGDMQDNLFVSGTDFTPGVTASLTLTGAYGSVSNIWVFFDGIEQDPSQIQSLDDFTLTFTSPIPVGITQVFVKGGTTLSINAPSQGTVTDKSIAAGSKVANRINNVVYVTDFGASTNNPDNSTAIQTALNTCQSSGGGYVYFPPGEYSIKSTLTVPSDVGMQGANSAAAFNELNGDVATKILWKGGAVGPMVTFNPVYIGSVSNIQFDGNFGVDICWDMSSCSGCLFSNVSLVGSRNVGMFWHAVSGQPAGLNTFINCMLYNHLATAIQFFGSTDAPITLNTFIGCRFAGAGEVLRLSQCADTNYFYGGRVESGTINLVINETGGDLSIDSVLFSGVTFDANPSTVSATTFIGPPDLVNADLNTVALFHMCHFTGSPVFNSAVQKGIVKVVDCPNFAAFYGGSGDYPPPLGIAATGSPFVYTNADPFAQEIIVAGGTISNINLIRAGTVTSLGLTSGSFMLQPNDSLGLTYSVAPSVLLKIPH